MMNSGMRGAHVSGSSRLTAAVCAVVTALSVLVSASTMDAAEVTGKLLNVTEGGRPVPAAEVRLLRLSGGAGGKTARVTTNGDGEFRFRRVARGDSALYRLETTYAGQWQRSEPFVVNRDEVSENLAVYDTTSVPKDISIEKVHIIVNPDAKGVGVTSIYIVQNWGKIFLGDPPKAGESRRIGVRFLLPSQATDFQVHQGMLTAHHMVTPWGFASTIPFYPGSDTLVFSYLIPWTDGRASFDVESPYQITSLSVIGMPGTAEIRVEGGEAQPSPMGGGMGQQLTNIGRSDIPPNTPVRVDVLPPGSAEATGTLSAGEWLIVIAGIALIAVLLFAIYVRQKHSGQVDVADEEGLDAEEAEETDSSEEVEVAGSPLVDDLVRQIAELDDEYEKGELGEADYVSRRRALKAQLIRAVKSE